MKAMLRFSLTMLLCLIVFLFVAPAAFAETIIDSGICGAQGDNLTWTLYDNGELVIEGTGEMENFAVDSDPNSLQCSYPWNSNAVQSVIIRNGVTSIGKCAFWNCKNLKSVSISESVARIGVLAFDACNLAEVTIPSGVRSIERSAFCYCSSLTKVTLMNGVESIGDAVFYGCDHLTSVSIPDTVTSIGVGTFGSCSSLTDVYYDGTQEQWDQIEIGNYNEPLASATIHFEDVPITVLDSGTCGAQGDNLTWTLYDSGELVIEGTGEMEDYSYEGTLAPWDDYCSAINSVTLENGLTSIGDLAFNGFSDLTSATIPASVTSIGLGSFFHCNNLVNVTIPNSVMNIGEGAFASCSSLLSISIPSSVTSIEGYAFDNCSSLVSVTIPDGVTSIGEGTFARCSSLLSISIPSSVTSIDSFAFYNCGSLVSVTIPDGVTSIGDYAFGYCNSLPSISIPDSVMSIGDYAFYDCRSLKCVTVPMNVSSIGVGCFSFCSNLTSAIISDGVTSISMGSFSNCSSLTSVIIPSSAESIGSIAFYNCTSLSDIYYGGTLEQWNQIEIGSNNEPLASATIHYLPEPDLILPAYMTAIEEEAFFGTAIVYPKLSDNTISIGRRAFADCPNLSYIYIPEATTDIDANAFGDLSTLTIFGKTGSTAETFAQTHGFNFVAVS